MERTTVAEIAGRAIDAWGARHSVRLIGEILKEIHPSLTDEHIRRAFEIQEQEIMKAGLDD